MTTTLYIARHGETEWNLAGKLQGHRDSPLTEKGRQQAVALAAALNNRQITRVYSSDLGRAVQTARTVAERLRVELIQDERLRERNFGDLEGKLRRELDRFRLNPDETIPGGESFRQAYERSVACLEELAGQNRNSAFAVICHGGIVQGVFHRTLGLPLNHPRLFSLNNASLNRILIIDGTWQLDTWGDVSHLPAL
ncbi:MAG: histidine phosphatase family protein [Desulfuromonadales bacterium]